MIESTKNWMRVINYEGEFIKAMEWFKSYVNSIKSKQKNTISLLFPTMFDLIKETMNDSDEVWRLVHQKYGMIQIIRTFY